MTSRKSSQIDSRLVVYSSFIDFMEDIVIPAEEKNPDHIRLDGKPKSSNGNTTVFGKFKHWGKTWRVNYDTYYFP